MNISSLIQSVRVARQDFKRDYNTCAKAQIIIVKSIIDPVENCLGNSSIYGLKYVFSTKNLPVHKEILIMVFPSTVMLIPMLILHMKFIHFWK